MFFNTDKSSFTTLKILLFATIIIVCSACTDEWRRTRESSSWTSTNPLNIPYNMRNKEYKSGNLIQNHSFEDGFPLNADSNSMQSIKHWTIIGNDVYYLENTIDSITPFGKRYILIHRDVLNETDSIGSGVLSDFIPVFPANYELSVKMKAKNIHPQMERWGTKLLDAIHIRIHYFDDNKNAISSALFHQKSNSYIDYGFKGFGFANIYSIDSIPWTHILPRSSNHPFADGNFPDNCRFVKIFIGLKGTGSLWIDDVCLKFSKWNFSTLERMHHHNSANFNSVHQLILPTPQYVNFKNNIPLINAGFEQVLYPTVVLLAPQTPINLYAQQSLSTELKNTLVNSYPDCYIKTTQTITPELLNTSSILFVLNTYENADTSLFAQIIPNYTFKPQSYTISDTIIGRKRIILLSGKDTRSLYYASLTTAQLLNKQTGLYAHSHIIDFPEFQERSVAFCPFQITTNSHTHISNTFQFLARNKLNNAYIDLTSNNQKYTQKHDSVLMDILTIISDEIQKHNYLSIGMSVSPYISAENDTTEPRHNQWKHNQAGVDFIFNSIKPFFDVGAKKMILNFQIPKHISKQNFTQHINNLFQEDFEKFTSLAQAQIYVLKQLSDKLNSNYSNYQIDLFPTWSNNEQINYSRFEGNIYISEMQSQIPLSSKLVWEGNTEHSYAIDLTDFIHFSNHSLSKLIFWDNSIVINSYNSTNRNNRRVVRLRNLFEPFEVQLTKDVKTSIIHFISRIDSFSQITKIRLSTLADYLWNPLQYSPEISLWKTLVSWYGTEAAELLITFNEEYQKLFQHTDELEFGEKVNKSLEKKIEQNFQELKELLEKNDSIINKKDCELYSELVLKVIDLEQRYNKLNELHYDNQR
jgi:hypothetical protein